MLIARIEHFWHERTASDSTLFDKLDWKRKTVRKRHLRAEAQDGVYIPAKDDTPIADFCLRNAEFRNVVTTVASACSPDLEKGDET